MLDDAHNQGFSCRKTDCDMQFPLHSTRWSKVLALYFQNSQFLQILYTSKHFTIDLFKLF